MSGQADTTQGNDIVVFYDAYCADGAGCAFALDRYYTLEHEKQNNADQSPVKFVPFSYSNPEKRAALLREHITPGCTAYFTDISLLPDEMDKVARVAGEIKNWDHHDTGARSLKGYQPPADAVADIDICVEQSASAALLAWDKLFPDEAVPELFHIIGKMEPGGVLRDDTVRGERQVNEYAIAAYIDSFPISTFEDIRASFETLMSMRLTDMEELGLPADIENYNSIVAAFETLKYARIDVPDTDAQGNILEEVPERSVYIPLIEANVRQFGRRINEALLNACETWFHDDMVGAWFYEGEHVSVSLRTLESIDASVVAESLASKFDTVGGGGKSAAVIKLPRAVFEDILEHARTLDQLRTPNPRLSRVIEGCKTPIPFSRPHPAMEEVRSPAAA